MVRRGAVVAVQLEETVHRLSGRYEELSTTAVDEELIINATNAIAAAADL